MRIFYQDNWQVEFTHTDEHVHMHIEGAEEGCAARLKIIFWEDWRVFVYQSGPHVHIFEDGEVFEALF
ncbi:unnamed protein product [Meloidogyne enterolobii]|uniref:Uncharacterized protein n=1 Tax=Meloidogyne enterolobii TaxID=390850 RepID=A0ACB0YAZ6_MELEN